FSNYMVRNDEIIKNSQDQLQAATIINTDFYNLTRAQIDKVKGQSQADFEISTYIEKLKKQVITLENISAENSENAKRLLERIKVVLKSSHGLDEREQKDKVINFWIAEQEENLE